MAKRKLFLVGFILNSVLLLLMVSLILFNKILPETGAIGIIGGEDGPTAIFI